MFFVRNLFLIVACVAGPFCAAAAEAKLALIFDGPTINESCRAWTAKLATDRGFDVKSVGPGQTTPELLARASLYMVPGGEALEHNGQGWSRRERAALRDFVSRGGRYVGICLGAYWAADWPGGTIDFESLRIVDAHVLNYNRTPVEMVQKIFWQGEERYAYMQEGPAFMVTGDSKTQVLATYDDGLASVLIADFGKGRVALSGVHLEAPAEWFSNAGLINPDRAPQEMADQFMDAVLSEGPGPAGCQMLLGPSPVERPKLGKGIKILPQSPYVAP